MINEIFTMGNLCLLIAAFPMLHTVWRNRQVLSDYNPLGATMTLLGLLVFWMAYIQMANWQSIVINSPTVVLWSLASFYSVRGWWRNRKVLV